MPITVLIADDHPIVRAGLRMVLDQVNDIDVVQESGDGASALEAITRMQPDVAVLDIEMPALSGIDVLRQMHARRLPTLGVILTLHDDAAMFEQAVECGAVGYLLKDSLITDVVTCIRRVLSGERYITPSLREREPLSRNAAGRVRAQLRELTPSELRVLRLICRDATTKVIAEGMYISPRTVDKHRANMCSKLNLRGAFGLQRFALMNRDLIEEGAEEPNLQTVKDHDDL